MTLNAPLLSTRLPSVDRLLGTIPAQVLVEQHGRQLVTDAVRAVLAQYRKVQGANGTATQEVLLNECSKWVKAKVTPSLRPVFNLTGTVLHTNLGRAIYAEAAIAAATGAMRGAVNLEYDIESADRGERDSHVEELLLRLTGAEAALVVNNNAAAVYLALNTLAAGREVLVSRGELVEIGGSFRVPDIMTSSGAKLREVGTTNRTHPHDYSSEIGPATAAMMKVHASNYEIRGFTCSVTEEEMSRIAHEHSLPLINDLGCGMLLGLEAWGLPHERTPREAIDAGADVVTFSGDKLMGGPQCGIVVGKAELIARMRRNPMKRVLRLDKVRLAALEATLRLYIHPDCLSQSLPTLRLLTRPASDIEAQAYRLLNPMRNALSGGADITVMACTSQVGSGALPVETLPSFAIALSKVSDGISADALARRLRALPIPVIGRIRSDVLLLDLRCLVDETIFLSQLADLTTA